VLTQFQNCNTTEHHFVAYSREEQPSASTDAHEHFVTLFVNFTVY